jgi:hypothetical protein
MRRYRGRLDGVLDFPLSMRPAVPLFVLIRHIWLLGLHTANASDWGAGWLNKRYFDRGLKFLRDWEADQLGSDQRLSTSPS